MKTISKEQFCSDTQKYFELAQSGKILIRDTNGLLFVLESAQSTYDPKEPELNVVAEEEVAYATNTKQHLEFAILDDDDDDDDDDREQWLNDFLAIPEQYRCNPYDISPSGDLFYADKRNVEAVEQSIKEADDDVRNGRVTTVKSREELLHFLDNL